MKKKVLKHFIVVGIILVGCAGTIRQGFKEPSSVDSMLIIGSIIVEDNYYTKEIGVYRDGIEVAILGRTEKGKALAFWTVTDKNGYFSIGDVPKGEYTLKGFHVLLKDGSYVTVSNRLNYISDPFLVAESELIIFEGREFTIKPVNRIVNLQHNHFILTAMSRGSRIVNHTVLSIIDSERLVDGKVYSEGPVVEYIMKKYPESQWISELKDIK
jgi:hypothetical protein